MPASKIHGHFGFCLEGRNLTCEPVNSPRSRANLPEGTVARTYDIRASDTLGLLQVHVRLVLFPTVPGIIQNHGHEVCRVITPTYRLKTEAMCTAQMLNTTMPKCVKEKRVRSLLSSTCAGEDDQNRWEKGFASGYLDLPAYRDRPR